MLKLNALDVSKQQDLKPPKHQKDVWDDVLKDALEKKVLELLGVLGDCPLTSCIFSLSDKSKR